MQTLKNLGATLFILCFMTACSESDGPSLLGSGNSGGSTSGGNIPAFMTFTNGQGAFIVLGQDDFVSSAFGLSATRYFQPQDAIIGASGRLWVSDTINSRILGYNTVPTSSGAAADFVIGQLNFTSQTTGFGANQLDTPYGVADNGSQLFLADKNNSRILVFNTITGSTNPSADFSIGSSSPSTQGSPGCTATTFGEAHGIFATTNHLYVADFNCRRVLIFNLPITGNQPTPIRVIGQSTFTGNAAAVTQSGLSGPEAVWSDDTKILIADPVANRVLIFNSFPTANEPNADFVIGQPNFTSFSSGTSQNTLWTDADLIMGVASNGRQIFVADGNNNRILIWNQWITGNGQNADVVLGQPDFTSNAAAVTQTGLTIPWSARVAPPYLLVSDAISNRVMVWKAP